MQKVFNLFPVRRHPFGTACVPVFLILLAVLLSACGSSSRVRYESPEEALASGLAAMEDGKPERAVLFFQGAFDFGRTHQWAADAQLYLARAYRANQEYLLAANEFTRFTQIYRSDPRVPDAEYELAMTYHDRSPMYKLDQTDSERAIAQFQLFTDRYPDHPLVLDANERIAELRGKLARKQMDAAAHYQRLERFEAAAITYEAVFNEYYDTPYAAGALLGAIQAHISYARNSIAARQEERLDEAMANYERLIQIFPESPLLKEAESLYLEIQSMLDDLRADAAS